jgi:SAM-dependent methyltransferase
MNKDFVTVTEIAGDEVTQEQIKRLCNRYYWAGGYCFNKDVLEVACGTGAGLGYLAKLAKSLEAGDYSKPILEYVRRHYGKRVNLRLFDAQAMPYKDRSKDVIILFEAIYYLPDATAFVRECARVLRPDGIVLIATANKDLYDFNPSPYSQEFYGVVELNQLFSAFNFQTAFFGDSPLDNVSLYQKALRPAKKLAVLLGLIPKTMAGKKFLKRIIFGKLVTMPQELPAKFVVKNNFPELASDKPNIQHKIIFCAANLVSN